MTQEDAFNKIVLFFYLLTLNDKKTLNYSLKASEKYLMYKDSDGKLFDPEIGLIKVCHEGLKNYSFSSQEAVSINNSLYLDLPDQLDFVPWREFHRQSSLEERMSLVLLRVLNLPIHKVALGTQTLEGSLRYRLNKALSLLGRLNRPSAGVF